MLCIYVVISLIYHILNPYKILQIKTMHENAHV